MKRINRIEKISIIFLFIILIVLMFIVPNMKNNINLGELIINEVMLVNNNTIMDKYGKNSDYIELYNGYDYDIDLSGYYLTDNMKETRKWSFPDVTIKKNDYLLIYASGKNTFDDEIHTNFKLDGDGETIMLSDNTGKIISRVHVENTLEDTSFGYDGNKYVYYYIGTPGKENTGEYSDKKIEEAINHDKVKITEIMTNNISGYKALDNKFYSVIELYNYGDKDIDLEGFYLSDKEDNVVKYKLPSLIIKSGEYKVVYASGLDKYNDKEIHTNFKLNNDDGVVILSAPNKSLVSKVRVIKMDGNTSYGLYQDKWYIYSKTSLGRENDNNYLSDKFINYIIINEVSTYPKEGIELYNPSDLDINLDGYSISDKSGKKYYFKNKVIKAKSYLYYGTSTLGFSINNTDEIIYLYHNDLVVDTFNVFKLTGNISTGRNKDGNKVYYKNITLGSKNSDKEYFAFAEEVKFSINGGYVEKNEKITLKTSDNSTIYYTTDGSFPNSNSTKYSEPITITKNMVIKAISYKDGYIESDIVSRTFIVGRKHDIAYISISSNYNNLFGNSGIITNYNSNAEKKISFEFYDNDGLLGTSFIGDIKISGMDSRREPQKSMSIYLRKKYGVNKVNYPFFKDTDYNTYSSLLLRNAGEDPKDVRIMDGALTRALKGEMDIDMQEYRPVVVYLNGTYYGIYSLREKLNGDYVESKFNINKENIDLIKYDQATTGNTTSYYTLVNYIKSHNLANKDSYEYVKSQVDIQELINYWIVESFYGNTDLGNIRYWKEKNGKWRWMVYDLDWSFWNSNIDIAYPTKFTKAPSITYLSSSLTIVRNLYKNSKFRDLYLKSLARYLKTTFKPERINKILDELKDEIKNEMPYHIDRWGNSYPNLNSMSKWYNNIDRLKSSITTRYNKVIKNLRYNFNLGANEYNKYFGDL